ncbi:diacylglycerol/polyprenol kinase family protein [Thermostichus vulcanus]|uniref:Phosphatidate cytidylyltransferase n=1 Tax=Thermostichus vulcanus str. 'Rupite' TaxID=2813851 RepID=A0ABT0CDC3_THEVL|nr:phosphatidate cytidylyltransferase [Thermostichus vulcanus]MCJ2543784.1 phosphatidate cytidylyltransferase [Thermostichus vulcanus str. 'Rupite']
MGLTQQIMCYALWLGSVFALAEWLRACKVDGEWVRKVIHIGVGNIILLAWALQVPRWLGVSFSLVFASLALLSYRVAILQSLNGVGRRSFGTCFYALSIGLLLYWFWLPERQLFAVIGILVMTWADALAGLVGKTWGQHRYQLGSIQKSWEGSLTMWGVSSLVIGAVLLGYFGFSPSLLGISVLVGGMAMGLEVFSWWGLDNLTVPLASGGLCFVLVQGLNL